MKRALVAVALAAAGCTSPLDAMFDDQFLWIFEHRGAYVLPDDTASAAREVFPMTTRDGVRIYGLWLPAARSSPTCVPAAVLYCSGQSGDLQDHYPQLLRLRELGYDVLAFDYRGNGMSEGETDDEEDTYVDAEAAAAELRRCVPGRRIVYYGESLGGAVCTELALRARPDALHLDCTFASIELFVRDGVQLPIPGEYVTSVTYDTISKIGSIGAPPPDLPRRGRRLHPSGTRAGAVRRGRRAEGAVARPRRRSRHGRDPGERRPDLRCSPEPLRRDGLPVAGPWPLGAGAGRYGVPGNALLTSGCAAMSASACSSSVRPGSILNQVDAPDGCGSGITSTRIPWKRARSRRPTTAAMGSVCPSTSWIASRPTGMTRRGRRIATSRATKWRQRAHSSGVGSRSPPPEVVPGKHRTTAAM